jgi:16S rRNA (adenine1518-N6/adenine1519-N6)-dimethyltransferase
MDLPGFVDPRQLLARYGLSPKRRLSQNFLVARSVVEAIARAATDEGCALVLELGAGLGTLTLELMRRCPRVVAVEQDADMLRVLRLELAPLGLDVRHSDATTIDYRALCSELGVSDLQLAGNLPYAATGAILRRIVQQRDAVSGAVLMLQREVRDRLVAEPGTHAYGALTVFCRAAFRVDSVLHVPAGAFVPRPKVDSSVVRLRPHPSPPTVESDAFREVVRAAFQQRRKTLRNALSAVAGPDRADAALTDAGLDGGRRGETLSIEEFAALAAAWCE